MTIVCKFGGTSVANLQKIENVGSIIANLYKKNKKIVVVLSAMGNTTDNLLEQAKEISLSYKEELDILLSTGEQQSIALLAMVLKKKKIEAKTFLGFQVPIKTSGAFGKSTIKEIPVDNLNNCLNKGMVAIVAGFQGVNNDNRITTLGRGGSDTTAVGLAVVLNATACNIYTDVPGIMTTDPRIESKASLIPYVTYEEMLELASLGAKVLHYRCVLICSKYKVPVRVLDNAKPNQKGTIVASEEYINKIIKKGGKKMETSLVTGITSELDESLVIIREIKDRPGLAGQILNPISKANIIVDVIVQNYPKVGMVDFSFTVKDEDLNNAIKLLKDNTQNFNKIEYKNDIVKLSVVGIGMYSHASVASKVFQALAEENINILVITTSEIKISMILESKYNELAVRKLHKVLNLDKIK